jgi:energy-coupling factor transport system substrate-specific component
MKNLTSDIYRFSIKSKVALVLTSIFAACGFTWPFFTQNLETARFAQYFFWIAMPLAFFLLISLLSDKNLDAKSVALLGILGALLAALRPLGAGAVGLEPMWFLLILAARVFGSAFGFLLGVTGMLTSAIFTGGIGPWLTYQAFAAGLVGLFAGAIFPQVRGRLEILLLIFVATFSALLIGLLMDLQFWPWAIGTNTQLSFIPGAELATNLHRFVIFHFLSSMAWDIPRAIVTSLLIIATGPAVLNALRRTKIKAAFLTPIEFSERAKASKAAL